MVVESRKRRTMPHCVSYKQGESIVWILNGVVLNGMWLCGCKNLI